MEMTKTLKPSGLKKPTFIPKAIIPTERLKRNTNILNYGATINTGIIPLACDFSNYLNVPSTSMSAGTTCITKSSSEMLDLAQVLQRKEKTKLRRSRSASDLNEVIYKPLKRSQTALAPTAAKITKYNSTISNNLTSKNFIPLLPAAVTNKSKVTTIDSSSCAIRTKTTTTKKVRKIPAYDYKARFNDLLEKHKVLKEKYEDALDQLTALDSLPEKYEDCQDELYKIKQELREEKVRVENLQEANNSLNVKNALLTKYLQKLKEDLDKRTEECKITLKEDEKLKKNLIELIQKYSTDLAEFQTTKDELDICKEQLFRANIERKDLHNAVMDLKGNIRVFCRVRPPLYCEEDRLLCGWNFIDESTLEIQNMELLSSGAKNKVASHIFSFDNIFHPKSTQEDIFQMVSPLIQSALDGYNICIFAYGQTGSGKTYTMDGITENLGVIPRTVDLLFESIKNYKRIGWEYEIKATFLEIYNEVLYDLLSNEQKEMEIRMAKNKTDIYVSNITEEIVTSANHLKQLMNIAKMNRATAATVGNERSSRSHAVTKIELIGRHNEKGEISIGSLNLVDLAGSESPKTSIRMNETKNINRSLSELTNVILALLQKQDHIPYRNSKLTHLLMPSLGGNSKTLMFINVAPFQDCFVESVKSLRFAASVNSCKLAKAKKNKYFNNSNISNTSSSNTSGQIQN